LLFQKKHFGKVFTWFFTKKKFEKKKNWGKNFKIPISDFTRSVAKC
jgi:hypothetical protein